MSPFLKVFVASCALAVFTGCAVQKYRPAPLSLPQTAAALETRSLADVGLRDYLAARSPSPPAAWPLPEWGLADLTLAAFYYNPALETERKRLPESGAAIITAAARPNPSISASAGVESAEAPFIAGLGFSLPIETAGKRRHRITEAERLADTARWSVAAAAWKTRAGVRAALLEYVAAGRSLDLLQAEERIRSEQVRLFEQRLAVGMISRPEVDTARIQQTRTLVALQAVEGRIAQARASLASAIGVPEAGLDGIRVVWPGFDKPPDADSLAPAKIREDAVLNRLDVRRALADYSASEAALQLEIAKQYPDINIGPGYAFEEGIHLFSVAVDMKLPVFDRNQGPIAEAKARRDRVAAQFVAVQAAGIADSEQALARYNAALSEMAQARRLIEQSRAQEHATEEALKAGESDRVTLNGAQLQTAVTSAAELEALQKAQQALGDLENAVQRPLLPGDIQPLSQRSPVLESPARNEQ